MTLPRLSAVLATTGGGSWPSLPAHMACCCGQSSLASFAADESVRWLLHRRRVGALFGPPDPSFSSLRSLLEGLRPSF